MLALLALFGFVPGHTELPVGPPAPHQAYDAGQQWRLSARPAWRAFRHRWGGEVAARWDARTGLPRFVYLPGVPLAEAEALVADLARLAGVSPDDLDAPVETARGDRVYLRYPRTWGGVPVEGDELVVVAREGAIAGVWVRLTPLGGLRESPRADEVILAVPPRFAPAVVRRAETDEAVWYLDRAGEVVWAYDKRRFGSVTHSYEARTVGDALLTGAVRSMTVTDAAGTSVQTAADGSHALTGALTLSLSGDELVVTDDGASLTFAGEDPLALEAGVDLSWSAADVLHHFYVVKDWLDTTWPTHAWLGDPVPADVDITASACNAYYTGGTINFYVGWPGYCEDLGRVADVVYHEYGHGIHEYILAAGTFAGDISEGSADYVSATINDDDCLAPGAFTSYACLRELGTDKVYPDDVVGEVHTDGLIWGSFLWNLREDWIADHGDPTGVEMTDTLFLGALEQGPSLTDLYEAVLLADDDNGDLTDGVPHACELTSLLDHHGLGPGPIGVVVFDHTPLGPQSSSAAGYPVSFELYDLLDGCSGLDPTSVTLWYTTDDTPVSEAGAADPGDPSTGADTGAPPAGGGWRSLPLTWSDPTWSGTFPRQPATTRVRYFLEATSTDGTQTVTTHGGREEDVWSFRVGDRDALWCEDFESGATGWTHGTGTPTRPATRDGWVDQWEVGTPTGAAESDPDAPYAGSAVMGTVIDGNYADDNRQYLAAPSVDVTGHGPMLLVSQARWLSVEDGRWDTAEFAVNGTVVYENLATSAGSTATLDLGWTLVEYAAEDLVAADGTLALTWYLGSDSALTFGGWNLDDVCIYQLADVAGHYRVDDLAATDDQGRVTVTWTQPWMTPLGESTLVRRRDAPPTGPTDGDVLHAEVDPTPGGPRTVVDTDLRPGETAWYAVFVSPSDASAYHTDAVTGENVDQGGVPAAGDSGTAPDSGAPDSGDSGPVDSGPVDSGPVDSGDSGPVDSGPVDGGADDSGPDDSGPDDSAPTDSAPTDETDDPDRPGDDPKPTGCGCGTPGAAPGLGLLIAGLAALRRRSR